jgi:hypothetical protein
MSLILAVEPDRRQAAHLTHIVRQRVGAELILAETTELALASIGNRVPDLILVPALMSPQDDAALAAALRVIATAAHVQMLTTPLFATAPPAPRMRGVLAAFRRSKPAAPPTDGCDPAEFAQQISSYLESAAEHRATAQYMEPPVPAPARVAETSQRYVPLEAGRLYRDEGIAYREIEAAPVTEAVPEPDLTQPEPVAEFAEPVVALESAPLIDDSAPAIYEPIEAYSETPDAEKIAEPFATVQEPIFEAREPILEVPEPIFEAPEPIFEAPEPTFEAREPIFKAREPIFKAPGPIFKAPEPIFQAPEPVLEAPEPALETPEPALETPEPLAALESTRFRRIGFVVHEEAEPELEPIVEVPSHFEVEPVEIAAADDTSYTLEAIEAPEPIAALTEPAIDETFELEVIVDEEDQDAGVIDLGADFEELHNLEAQTDLHAIEPFDLLETDAVEAATGESESDEVLEMPEIVEAAEPARPQVHTIQADPLKEFAAALEAMTAAGHITVDAGAAAPEAIEFDDLFPRREPVEPSPLGAWRSWTTLEGMVAEASDAPVPAHVVERAVDRAPERPDWVQLVESLRIDVERRRSEHPSAAPQPPRKAPSRPVQDEWGLFDPAQCGFAALLAKLDEITDANESQPSA